jgi:hypothetical protein
VPRFPYPLERLDDLIDGDTNPAAPDGETTDDAPP